MSILAFLIHKAIELYIIVIIIQVIVSWLITFEVINTGNKQAQNLINLLKKLTDPVYKPIQKFIPPLGGIDLTPLVVIIGLTLIQSYIIVPVLFRMGAYF